MQHEPNISHDMRMQEHTFDQKFRDVAKSNCILFAHLVMHFTCWMGVVECFRSQSIKAFA